MPNSMIPAVLMGFLMLSAICPPTAEPSAIPVKNVVSIIEKA